MIRMGINLGEKSYPIYVARDYAGLGKGLSSARLNGRIVLVTDTNVEGLQAEACLEALRETGFQVDKLVLQAGEKYKNLDTVKEIYRFLTARQMDRNTTLITLGGGVVGDITGFAAATYMRGIHFVQVPTTLLAQADSSVGGKVGVDFEGSKNMVGAFYQPKFVYINVDSLKTLPQREMQAGLAEVIKHGVIMDEEFFDYVEYNIRKIYGFDPDVLQYMAKTNCTIKGNVVEQDEKEKGLRAILNFGHTYGHAIESAFDFTLLHGECVSVGMVGAFKLARALGMTEEAAVNRLEKTLEKAGLPTRLPGMDTGKVFENLFHDKKMKHNKLVFILPRRIGEVLECNVEDLDLVKAVLEELA